MPSDNYPYAIGRIKIIENSLLDDPKLQRLNELPFDAAVRQLSDWGYAADYPVRDDVDALIDFRMAELHEIIDDVTPDKELTDLFWLSLDATNLKYLIKARILGSKDAGQDELEKGVFDLALLQECVEQKDYAPLGQPLAGLLNEAEQDWDESTEPRVISAAVDNAVYTHIFSVLKRKHNPFCTQYFTAKADFTNIFSVLRARALSWDADKLTGMLLDGGEIPFDRLMSAFEAEPDAEPAVLAEILSFGVNAEVIRQAALLAPDGIIALTQAAEEHLLDTARQERFDSFGIGPIAYFLLRGIDECRTLRVLFARKRANL